MFGPYFSGARTYGLTVITGTNRIKLVLFGMNRDIWSLFGSHT
jgi:hypothetical protein